MRHIESMLRGEGGSWTRPLSSATDFRDRPGHHGQLLLQGEDVPARGQHTFLK